MYLYVPYGSTRLTYVHLISLRRTVQSHTVHCTGGTGTVGRTLNHVGKGPQRVTFYSQHGFTLSSLTIWMICVVAAVHKVTVKLAIPRRECG